MVNCPAASTSWPSKNVLSNVKVQDNLDIWLKLSSEALIYVGDEQLNFTSSPTLPQGKGVVQGRLSD